MFLTYGRCYEDGETVMDLWDTFQKTQLQSQRVLWPYNKKKKKRNSDGILSLWLAHCGFFFLLHECWKRVRIQVFIYNVWNSSTFYSLCLQHQCQNSLFTYIFTSVNSLNNSFSEHPSLFNFFLHFLHKYDARIH